MAGGTQQRTLVVNVVGDSTGLRKSNADLASSSEATGGRMSSAFKGAFGAIATASGGALGPIQGLFDSMGPAMEALSQKGKTVGGTMVGVGAGIAGAGAALTAFGSTDKAATQQLAAAITSTGGSIDDFQGRIDSAVKTNEKFGSTASGTTDAIRILTQSTGDTGKALDLMSVASNLAAAKHESLSAAATTLAKMQGGSNKVLKEYGIVASTNKDKTQAVTENIDALSKKLSGQASASADTFTGRMKGMKTELEDQAATIGAKYGPALTGAGAGISVLGASITGAQKVMGLFKHSEEIEKTTKEALTAATAVQTMATEGETAAEAAEIPVETAAGAPILLIVAAVALLAIGIYELVTHWKAVWGAIKAATKDAIDFVGNLISGVVDFVKAHWQLLVAILAGPIGVAVLLIKDHFGEILSFITGLPGRISTIAVGMFDGIKNAFRSAINGLIDIWDHLGFTLPSINWGPIHLSAGRINVPQIPHLAEGGIISGPTIALLGENGPEKVTPLGHDGGQGGNVTVNVPLYIDGRAFAKATAQFTRAELLAGTARSTGRVGLS